MTIELTVLGCATPYPSPGHPCSGYLVHNEGTHVWIDAGGGTWAELQRHIRIEQVDAIWISHLHPDHSVDLLSAWNAYVNTAGLPRPIVAGPPGWEQNVDGFLGRCGGMRETFNVVDLADGHTIKVGNLTMTAREMRHGVPTYGVRLVSASGAVLAYSADTAPCDALVELAADADLLVVEAGADEPHPGHCTPEDAASGAMSARARRVLLTHLAPGLTADAAARRAQSAGMDAVDVAVPGMRTQIRPQQ